MKNEIRTVSIKVLTACVLGCGAVVALLGFGAWYLWQQLSHMM